jgi:hypothetical protein
MTTLDHPETVIHAHRATHAALATFAASLEGMSPDTIARLLLGASASVVAATLGTGVTAALLRELAAGIELDSPRLN